MKRKLSIFGIVLIFLAGIGVMSYPLASSIINNISSRSHIEEYTKTTKQMSADETLKMFDEAQGYNNSLTNNVVITDPFDKEAYEKIGANYENALNVDGNGLIGYIDVPKINVYLPIYHGTSDKTLSKGAGHLLNTSLPIGGESTHSVISAHTAYPGETFFDYLTDMEEGDVFYVHVLDRVLKYEVDSVKVILPEETNDLRIIRGEDHVTLLTCTPYSVNTHRLLVKGNRVEYDDSKYLTMGANAAKFGSEGMYFFGLKLPYWALTLVIAGFVVLVAIIVFICLRRSKKKRVLAKKDKDKDNITEEQGGE